MQSNSSTNLKLLEEGGKQGTMVFVVVFFGCVLCFIVCNWQLVVESMPLVSDGSNKNPTYKPFGNKYKLHFLF
jgi:hypothetical protein